MKNIILATFIFSLSFVFPVFAATFDGNWKVSREGFNCTPNGLITTKIKSGQFSGSYNGASGEHVISGEIASSGKFKFVAKSPSDNVIFKGKIKGDSGDGSWTVSGSGRNCAGTLKIFK